MPLTVIKCGLCAEPAKEYLSEIKELYTDGEKNQLILLVPDHFSYLAEKRICDTVGGAGLSNVSVLTLHQLVRSLSEENRLLSAVGKQMLIKKALMSLDENNIFARSKNKSGFISEILDTVSTWKTYCVDENALQSDAKELPTELLCEKLLTTAKIFSEYKSLIEKSGCTDDCDELKLAAEEIRKNPIYKNAYIWIDEFCDFSPMELDIISAFLEGNANLKIYLPITDEDINSDDAPPPVGSYYDLMKLCAESNFTFKSENAKSDKPMSEDLKFLCNNFGSGKKYTGNSLSAELTIADDIYSETEYAAAKIIDLVKDYGYKFSDIAVMCGGLESYTSCIEAIFENYKIPYFSDYKVPLSGHPISILILSVFEIVEGSKFPLKSMIRYLKTGYAAESADDADLISVYASKRGIVGNMWLNPRYFQFEQNGFFADAMGLEEREVPNAEHIEEIRKEIVMPLCSYAERSKGRKTTQEHIKAFFEYLTEINLFDKLESRIDLCTASGDDNEASRLTHVWNILINIFDQMAYSIAEDKITRTEFAEYLRAGIEGSNISIIPTVTNGVAVSNSSRRSGSAVKALFILGAGAETVPKIKKEDGFFSDDELELLPSLPKAASKSRYNRRMEFELQRSIADTSERLYISVCKTDMDGNKVDISPIFDLICEKLPKCRIKHISGSDISSGVTAPQSMLHRLLAKLSNEEMLSAADKCAVKWFEKNEKYKNAFSLLNEAVRYNELRGSISKDISAELYKDITKYSVSRLEKYFKCPFSYFLSYGLLIGEEKESGIQSTDTGSLIHFAAAKFCEEMEKGAETHEEKRERWLSADKQQCREILNGIMDEIKSKTELDAKGEAIIKRIEATLIKTADLIVTSIVKSKYSVLSCELDFSGFTLKSPEGSVELGGIIDRIDCFDEADRKYARIIDYKTGNKAFQPTDILNGVDIQLIIYAMAAGEFLGRGAEISGMFYNSLKKRIATGKTAQEAENKLKNSYKLAGCVFEDFTDKSILAIKSGEDMDIDLTANGESTYLPLKLKKDNKSYNMSSSSALSRLMLSKMSGYVRDMVISAANDIKAGDVKVYPFKGSCAGGACSYCPYGTICMFDIEKGAQINDGSRGNEIFKELKEEDKL